MTIERLLPRYTRGRFALLVCSALAGVPGCSSTESDGVENPATVDAVEHAAAPSEATAAVTLGFPLHESLSLKDIAVSAREYVRLADRVDVGGATSVAQGRIEAFGDAKLGSLAASGEIKVGHRTVVNGDALAGGALALETSTRVTGAKSGNLGAKPPVQVQWTVQAPTTNLGPVLLSRDQSRHLEPARYGHLTVQAGATVTLRTGVYVFDDVTLEGKLLVDDREGPVQIVLNGRLTFRGSVGAANGSIPQVLFAVQGTAEVTVERPFVGVLLAPNAAVRLQAARPQGHRAVVVGKSVWLEPDTKIQRLPFAWSTLLGPQFEPIPEGAPVHTMTEDDLGLTVDIPAVGGTSTTKRAAPTPAQEFTLPDEYTVAGGVIGNGTVVFRFKPTGSGVVTCTYRGQSSTARPATRDELVKGTLLRFESCSDGRPAGARRSGTDFEMTVNPSPDYPVTVNPPLQRPNVCNDRMELLTPAQTHAMRQSFNWSSVTKVADRNADGTPTLYPAWIYVRNKEEALALKRLFIHVLSRPLFDEELQKYAGKCGTFSNPGDGEGTFVPVVIPGTTYNRLIDVRNSSDVTGDRNIFDAVVLRQVPTAARNANGSINHDTLRKAGFRYLGYESDPFAADENIVLDGGPAKALLDAMAWVAQAAREVSKAVTGLINEIDQGFNGEVQVDLFVHAITRDPFFGNNVMERAWGGNAGTPIGAPGMRVTILQKMTGFPVPTTAHGYTDSLGHVRIDATDGAATRGSGLCIELQTRAALVTDFLIATEVCDLRGFDAAAGTTTAVQDFRLDTLTSDRTLRLNIDNLRLLGLYQSDDVYRYATDVMFYTPKRARILSGYWATTFTTTNSGGDKRLYTPCLNFPNTLTEAMTAAAAGTGAAVGAAVGSIIPGIGTAIGGLVGSIALSAFAAVVGNTDIVMSPESRLRTSRGVMSHEYGHYVFCNVIYESNPAAVDHVIWGTIVGGDDIEDPLRYTNEAIAEFFEGQVASGLDYDWLPDGDAHSNDEDQYCARDTTPCWDSNLRGDVSDDIDQGEASIGRVATLLLDVFDGQGAARTANVPTDADAWQWDGTTLSFNRTRGGDQVTDTALERVALPGPDIRTVAAELAAGMLPFIEWDFEAGEWQGGGHSIDDRKIRVAVDATMQSRGLEWCDRCRVLALHEPGTASMTNVQELWNICTTDPDLQSVIGPPPHPLMSLQASDCERCPDGSVSNASGTCEICPPDAIDLTLNGNALSFDAPTVVNLTTSAAGDACPNLLVVKVENADAIFSRGGDYFGARLNGAPVTTPNCERRFSLLTTVFDGSGNPIDDTLTSEGSLPECTDFCLERCSDVPERSITPSEAAGGEVIFRVPALPNAQLEIYAGEEGTAD